jgi:hypothetical protein
MVPPGDRYDPAMAQPSAPERLLANQRLEQADGFRPSGAFLANAR